MNKKENSLCKVKIRFDIPGKGVMGVNEVWGTSLFQKARAITQAKPAGRIFLAVNHSKLTTAAQDKTLLMIIAD